MEQTYITIIIILVAIIILLAWLVKELSSAVLDYKYENGMLQWKNDTYENQKGYYDKLLQEDVDLINRLQKKLREVERW